MNKTESEMLKNNNKILLRMLKSLVYTVLVIMVVIFGVQFVLFPIFQDDVMSIISGLFIAIIMSIFYNTFTIIDEIRSGRDF